MTKGRRGRKIKLHQWATSRSTEVIRRLRLEGGLGVGCRVCKEGGIKNKMQRGLEGTIPLLVIWANMSHG